MDKRSRRGLWRKCRAVGLGLFLGGVLMLGLKGTAISTASEHRKVVAYFVEWGVYGRDYHVADIPADKITHINYAFAKVENGKVAVWDSYAALEKLYPETDSWNDPPGTIRGNFNQLRLLKERYPHIKVLISMGGWTGSGDFSTIAATEEGRRIFAQSALDFIQTYDFDGVDIDWEFPVSGGLQLGKPEDRENFTRLLRELRLTLGDEYLLTIASSGNPDRLALLEIEDFVPYLDWISLMTYDYHGSWEANGGKTGHNAPLYNNNDPVNHRFNIDSAVKYLIERGVPAQKIVVGLAFYGRSASGVQGEEGLYAPFTGPGPGSFEDGLLDYKDIKENYLEKNGYDYFWDDTAKVPYLFNQDRKEFVSFDDSRSIEGKASYVAGNDLSGVMFWELSGDNGELIEAISSGFGNPDPPDPEYACSDGRDNDNDGRVDYPDDPGCEAANDDDESDPSPPPPDGAVTAEVTIGSDWGSGYCANVKVTNQGDQPADWVVEIEIEGSISSFWSATYDQAGNRIKAQGVSWNRTLQPGGTTTFGFCVERTQESRPACSDGVDNDGDGLIDYPVDPGCGAAEDDDEVNETPPAGDLEVNVTTTSDWGSGYCADVSIANRSGVAVDWATQFEIAGTVSSLWNAKYSQQGNIVSVEGLSWNNTISPNQAISIGFCATR